jgi:hypothetical protein
VETQQTGPSSSVETQDNMLDENKNCIQKDSIERCFVTIDNHIKDNLRHVEGVHQELKLMRENHLHHIQQATETQARSQIETERRLGDINILSTKTAVNQEWLLKYHWIVATTSIGALVTSLLNLIMK